MREAVHETRVRHPFTIDAWVLLPEHMHCIWTLPRESSDFSMRWNLIKAGLSRRAKSFCHVDEWMNDSKRKHGETTIWQRRFWEHQIRNERDYQVYMDYTHFNQVKHRLVQRVAGCVATALGGGMSMSTSSSVRYFRSFTDQATFGARRSTAMLDARLRICARS